MKILMINAFNKYLVCSLSFSFLFLKSSTSHYNNNMTSGIFAGHNHDDHPIYGNILCDVKCVGWIS